MARVSKIDQLVDEFQAWQDANGRNEQHGDAMDNMFWENTPEQYAWLSNFVIRWDAASREDRLFYDKQTVVAA